MWWFDLISSLGVINVKAKVHDMSFLDRLISPPNPEQKT